MIGRTVRKLFLPRLLAIHVLIVWHVMLENGVSGGILQHAQGGIDSHLAVKHDEVLAPGAGRLSLGGKVRLPIAHDLHGDTTLQRQAVASYNFLFRKEMLPCEHVKWRKRKMIGRTHLVIIIIDIGIGCIGGRRPLDALVILEQTRVCSRNGVDERSCLWSELEVDDVTHFENWRNLRSCSHASLDLIV